MYLKAETHEFGIEMNMNSQISLVEKMDKSETFWKMTFEKFPIESDTEFELSLDVKPIKIIYDAVFV